MPSKPNILVLTDYYLPGFKGGGPTRALSNLTDVLSDQFQFSLVTRDRDLGECAPYHDLPPNIFIERTHYEIAYLRPGLKTLITIFKFIKHHPHHILYLNSFFSPLYSIFPLIIKWFSFKKKRPTIVSPRGELLKGALGHKTMKKKVFFYLSKLFGLHKNIIWQASNEMEKTAILRIFKQAKVIIAPDIATNPDTIKHSPKIENQLRVIYLGRICPQKNLLAGLEMLSGAQGDIRLDIYGSIEDRHYFEKCQRIMKDLPNNIQINYKGVVAHQDTLKTLQAYDLFFLPTKSENFGFAIIESLSVGTPVLISDTTPWNDLTDKGAGFTCRLSNPSDFSDLLTKWVTMDETTHQQYRQHAIAYAQAVNQNNNSVDASKELFEALL